MIYRPLGKTGLDISLLSLGTLYWGDLDAGLVSKIVDKSAEAGINHIDTARVYGGSEAVIGKVLKGRRERFTLATKGISRRLDSFKRDLETSFSNLQTDYLDLFYLHSVSDRKDYETIMNDGLYDYVANLKAQGRIRHIVVSSHDVEFAKVLVKSGNFDALMVSYNAADRSPEPELLPLCSTSDMGVVVMKPFGGGVLTQEQAGQYNISATAKSSLKFCMANPHVTTVIPGVTTLAQLDENLEVVADIQANGYNEAERESTIEGVASLGSDFCRGCGYCRPCPQNIDIPALMGLYSRRRVFEGRNWQQMEAISSAYASSEVKADVCSSCGSCVERCPYRLPIPKTMRTMTSW